MTKLEALELIEAARGTFSNRLDDSSALNPRLTIGQGLDIVEGAIDNLPELDTQLGDIIEKRVYQVTRNQVRPRYS